jgi:hypothetical protein
MWDLLTDRVTVRRATAVVLDPVSAATTLTWTRQPVRETVVELRVHPDGTTGSGTLTITGTAGGVAQTETLIATGPGWFRSTYSWTALAGLTTSGLADEATPPLVSARAVGRDGSPQEAHYTLRENWPAAIQVGGASGGLVQGGAWPNDRAAGRVETTQATVLVHYDETWTPMNGDLLDDSYGRTWQIVGKPRVAATTIIRHWYLRVREYEVT